MFEETGTGQIFAVCLEVSSSTFLTPSCKLLPISVEEAMLIYLLISSRSFHHQVHFFDNFPLQTTKSSISCCFFVQRRRSYEVLVIVKPNREE